MNRERGRETEGEERGRHAKEQTTCMETKQMTEPSNQHSRLKAQQKWSLLSVLGDKTLIESRGSRGIQYIEALRELKVMFLKTIRVKPHSFLSGTSDAAPFPCILPTVRMPNPQPKHALQHGQATEPVRASLA